MWSLVVVKTGNKWFVLAAAVLLGLVLSPRASAWAWPVDGTVLRPFVAEDDPYAGGQHRGIDIGAPAGADVRSAATGVVAFVGQLPHEGLCLTIRTADGYSVTLVHLGSIGVRTGTAIEEGEVVGTIGPSGDAEWAEPYVHLGIRLTAEPHGYLDPLSLLPSRPAGQPQPRSAEEPAPVAAPAGQPLRAQPPPAKHVRSEHTRSRGAARARPPANDLRGSAVARGAGEASSWHGRAGPKHPTLDSEPARDARRARRSGVRPQPGPLPSLLVRAHGTAVPPPRPRHPVPARAGLRLAVRCGSSSP